MTAAVHPAVVPVCKHVAPKLSAALRLLGFPAGNVIVCVERQPSDVMLPGHVEATCCVCGCAVQRHHLSLQVADSAAGCIGCLMRGIADAKRMGAA